jgi:hypothetical protein
LGKSYEEELTKRPIARNEYPVRVYPAPRQTADINSPSMLINEIDGGFVPPGRAHLILLAAKDLLVLSDDAWK